MLYAVAILASLALVLANAFLVASEFAIINMRPSRLEQLATQGRRQARVGPLATMSIIPMRRFFFMGVAFRQR